MKRAVYLSAICLCAYIRSGTPTPFETVWIKDVTTKFQTDKRTLIDLDLPNDLTFHLTRGSEILTLDLKRNHDINPHADVYIARKLKNGQPVLVKSRNYEKEDVAYYQDRENWAYMTVKCIKKSSEPCDRIINGNLRIGDRTYAVEPVETDVTSRNVVEDPSSLGIQYVLKDQAYMQRGYPVQKKGRTPVKENDGEHKIKDFLQRLRGQHRQNNLSPLDDALYSRNVATAHNRIATETRVLQYEPVHNEVIVHDSDNVKVNLIYKGIQDTGISINVILARFIYFEKYNKFPYQKSQPAPFNRTNYIDVRGYLFDLEQWDLKVGVKYQPPYDHGMLFTKYTLYLDSLTHHVKNNISVGGLAFRGQVCENGLRTSIVMIEDLTTTVTSAAHELGHSLGAFHDGEGEATGCRAEDQFIMTGLKDKFDQANPYFKNEWVFSPCSLESIKRNLMNKTCVTSKGDYHNHQDYTQHVTNEAGEVFSADKQCELFHGQKSVVCETSTANICNFMRCKDPKNRHLQQEILLCG